MRRPSRLFVLPALAVLAACAAQPTPAPLPDPSPTPTPAPSVAESPLRVSGVLPFQVASGRREFLTDAARPVRLVVAAGAEAGTPSVRLTVDAGAARPYRVSAPGAAWPLAATPRWQAVSPRLSRRLSQASEARAIGSSETFWINNGRFKPEEDRERPAVLRHLTPNAYFYVDRQSTVSDTALAALAGEFEARIYPGVTGVFGPEARPGVDGDARIFIVITSAFNESGTDLLAYFWARDAVPEAHADAHSNHQEVLFMSDRLLTAARIQRHSVLAHELQHLINFSRKGARLGYVSQEATWLDEGLSMMAMDLAGYGLEEGEKLVAREILAYLTAPEAYSLTDWGSNPNGSSFGQNYLFMRYVVDRYGAGLLKELIDSNAIGVAAVDAVVAKHGTSFAGVFRDWAIANLHDGRGPAPYRYERVDLRGSYAGISLPGITRRPLEAGSVTLKPWGSAFFTLPAGVSRLGVEPIGAPAWGGVAQD